MKVRGLVLGVAAMSSLVQPALAADAPPGATLPWVTYEAEQSTTTGTVLGPDFTGHTPAREASGRRCVQLSRPGESLEFAAASDANALVVRYCIPDTADGRGANATLSLYVNGQRKQKLSMTSRYAYLYGTYPYTNDPSVGTPRHFWDELRLMPGAIHSGDTIRLQKDADDKAQQYLIDFIDLEQVSAPLSKPDDALSITDFGAKEDGSMDAHVALVTAIAAAKGQGKSVWIPAGRFLVKGAIEVSDVTVAGAGMWYSTLVGVDDYAARNRISIIGAGSNIHLSDFAVLGNLNYRNDTEGNDGIGGSFGTGSSLRNLWVEHTKTGAWIVNSDGLLVEGCRFRDTIADGINLCVGMHNTAVRNCTARGNGDDCFAMWPTTYVKPVYVPGGNRFVHCTGQLPFLAQAFSIYGGAGNSVEDCAAIDIPYGAGLYASTTFPTEFGFRGTTTYRNVRLTRTGDADGAIGTVVNLLDLAGLRFNDIDVVDSPADGLKFTSVHAHVLSDTTFTDVRVNHTGLGGSGYGIVATPQAVGSVTLQDVTVRDAKSGTEQIGSHAFHLVREPGNANAGSNLPSDPTLPSSAATSVTYSPPHTSLVR